MSTGEAGGASGKIGRAVVTKFGGAIIFCLMVQLLVAQPGAEAVAMMESAAGKVQP